MSRKYVYLDHTADLGFLACGNTVEDLFAHAAEALFAVLTTPANVRPTHRYEVELEAEDLEALMVQWLNELLFRFETRSLLLSRFQVHQVKDARMNASCWGESIDPDRHRIKTGIKAATYHRISIKQRGRLWQGRVFLDL